MKRATFFKSSGSISLSSPPSADQSSKDKAKDRDAAKASGRQSIRGRISAPIPYADPAAPAGPAPAPTPAPTAAADPAVPASLPISMPIAPVSPVASPVTEAAPVKLDPAEDGGPHLADADDALTQAEPDKVAHADDADININVSASHDNAYDADLDDTDKGKALLDDKGEEKDDKDEIDDKEEAMEMANSPEPMPPLHSQKQRLDAMSPAGHRRVQTLDAPKQQPTTALRPPHLSQPPPSRQQTQQTQQTQPAQQTQSALGPPFGHRTNPSNTLRYSTASGASGTASMGGGTGGTATSGENTANSSPKPHRKKSTLRGALSKLFGRKKMGMSLPSQGPHGHQKTDSYMPTIDDHYGDYEKELERGPNHRSVRSDPTVLSTARGEAQRSASLPISEFDRALRSHSVGPEEMVAIESARNSLTVDRVASITNMSNLSNLSNLSHVASLDGGRRRAATTTRVSLYPSPSLGQPLQARRRFGNNSAEVLGGAEWTGLSPRPASAHGRGISRLSSYSHSNGHGLSASTSQVTPGPAADLAISTSHVSPHLSHMTSTSMSARHDPSEIGRAITSDGLEADTMAHRRRSRSLSGLAEISLDGVQARRRSDEIRYWRESYDPTYLSPLSSRHGDDEDEDDDEYDGEGEDIHDEYTRPDYEGDDESEGDSDADAGDDDDDNNDSKADAFQQRNSLSNVIHASKLQRILQTQAQVQAQTQDQTETAEQALQPAPGKPVQEFPFATSATAVSTRIPRPVSSHSVKAIAILSANAANSMNAGGSSSSSAHAASSAADKTGKMDRTDARLGGLETRMNRMESVVDQLCHSVPGFKSPSQPQSQSAFHFDVPRSVPASAGSPYAYVTDQPAIPPIPAIYQSQVAQVQSLSQSQSQYSMRRRSFDLDTERDGDQDEIDDGHSHMSFGDGQTYIGSIPPSSSATQAPSMLATSGPFESHQSQNHNHNHHLVHHESTASLQTANLLAQLESERAVRQTLETQVKKLNERVNMLSTTMYAMLRDPAAAAAASKSAKSTPSPQSPRRSPSSASVAASIAAAQLKADTVIQTAKALGHGTPRDTAASSHTFSVESGGITPKGFIHDTSPSEYYYGNDNENEDPIHDSDSKRRKAARTLSLGQLTLGKSAVQP